MRRWQLCGLAALGTAPAWAQLEGAEGPAEVAAGSGYLLQPRLSLTETITNNVFPASGNRPVSDQVTMISPGLRLLANQARLTGFLDYGLNGIYRAQGSAGDSVQQVLNAAGNLNAYENRAFVDMSATVSQQSISAFGAPAGAIPGGPNQTQVTTWRVSPYTRGLLPDGLSYEARYFTQGVRTATSQRPNSETQGWSAQLGSQGAGRLLGWSIDANQQTSSFNGQPAYRFDTLRASLSHPFTSQLSATATLGSEANDLGSGRKSHGNYGVGTVWHPSDRTTFSADVMERYFGTGYDVSLEQRGARTVWRYTASRNAMTAPTATAASLGNLYDLLDSYYRSFEPDPLRRAVLVQAELQKSGLPTDLQARQNLLSSTLTLRQNQQLSLMLLGQRDTLTLLLSQGNVSRLQPNPVLQSDQIDDLANLGTIKSKGWSAVYAHRLTPLSNLTATWSSQHNEGAATGASSTMRLLTVSLGTKLSLRSSATLTFRRGLYERIGTSGAESALSANLTLWF